MDAGSSGGGSRTLSRGLTVLSALGTDPEGLTVAQLADRTGLDRAVLYRLLTTLCEEGLAVRDNDSLRFRLGVALVALGAGAARGLPVRRHARPGMRALMEQCREAVCLAVRDRDHAVVVDRVEPPGRSARIGYHVGLRHPLDRGAHGKAVLGSLEDGDPALAAFESASPELPNGYAVAEGDLEGGIVGVAAPIREADGTVAASVGIVAPATRLPDAGALGPSVRALADEVSRRLADGESRAGSAARRTEHAGDGAGDGRGTGNAAVPVRPRQT
ncbi:IclR family transcriptional regulator [Egibacter rhizosphaerae]|uniref:IclR family transcriptional regulator n=1 Tax=Egibacter rhizosphaerae TaxID=1670831 RepID=A0A411YAP2_9ACTN|nr:IclR family transcriptional regulator [Egibacter rhizosphaerae]QBI18247.1 IclR family transcriptional regulator [Egibacter rhizosphaerae]